MNLHDLFNLLGYLATFNLLMMFLLMDYMTVAKKFTNWCRSHDGHWFGLILQIYAVISAIGGLVFLAHVWNSDFVIGPRVTVLFFIFTNLLPFLVGREIWAGKKFFT